MNHQCPADCPHRPDSRVQRIGLRVGAIALTLFLGAWVARGCLERKTPSVFEIGFAIACIYLLQVDPKAAQTISTKAVMGLLPPAEQ